MHCSSRRNGRLVAWERQCLSEKDLTGYDFLSASKDGFVPVSVQPASETRLRDVVSQYVC
jgi:hypothetical protein